MVNLTVVAVASVLVVVVVILVPVFDCSFSRSLAHQDSAFLSESILRYSHNQEILVPISVIGLVGLWDAASLQDSLGPSGQI